MKTVMKKMFSLLLVAVLLVSAVPTAFADAIVCTKEGCTYNGQPAVRQPSYDNATCTEAGKEGYYCQGGHIVRGAEIPALGHTPGAAATCTTAQTCTKCGVELTAALGHTPGAAATCTTAQTCTVCGTQIAGINASAHAYSNGICSLCGVCEDCGLKTCICCDKCDGTTSAHAANCPTQLCPKGCGAAPHGETPCCSECNGFGHQKTSCPNLYETCCNVAKGSAHRADCVTNCTGKRDCTNANHKPGCLYALCNVDGCQENEGHTGKHTGVPCSDANCKYDLNHDGKHSYLCPEAGCDKAVGHTGNHSNVPEVTPGDSYLVVNVNLWTSDVKTETYQLARYDGISSDTMVYDFIADHRSQLKAKLPNGYTWNGSVYDNENDWDAEIMNAKVGNGRTVYINAYTGEALVLIAVHNSRTMSPLGGGYIHLHGKQIGETVTRAEVLKAVSKQYNVTSLKMYDEQSWEDYVAGETVQHVDTLKITSEKNSDAFFIDVRITGSAKSSSGSSYTADSSNPKTGDTIFAPVAVMGLSVSALAVLLFLNKKRAF